MFASKAVKASTDVSIRSRHLGSREGATRPARAQLSPPEHAKLSVGRSDDPLEYDARRLADEIMRVPDSAIRGVRPGNSPAHEMKEEATEDGLSQAPPVVNEVLREQGRPLDPMTRTFLNRALVMTSAEFVSTRIASRIRRSVGLRERLYDRVGCRVRCGPL
jgi:hypothetical protein